MGEGDPAAVEDESGFPLRRGGSDDVAGIPAVDLSVREIRGGRAIDEITVAGDIAFLEVMPSTFHFDRILPADDAAAPERHAIGDDGAGLCLHAFAVGILNC